MKLSLGHCNPLHTNGTHTYTLHIHIKYKKLRRIIFKEDSIQTTLSLLELKSFVLLWLLVISEGTSDFRPCVWELTGNNWKCYLMPKSRKYSILTSFGFFFLVITMDTVQEKIRTDRSQRWLRVKLLVFEDC